MGSFYYGYCVTNIPGAWMAKRYGIRIVLGLSSLICALLTLLVPLVAQSSLALLVALRITLGAFQVSVAFYVSDLLNCVVLYDGLFYKDQERKIEKQCTSCCMCH